MVDCGRLTTVEDGFSVPSVTEQRCSPCSLPCCSQSKHGPEAEADGVQCKRSVYVLMNDDSNVQKGVCSGDTTEYALRPPPIDITPRILGRR